MTGDPILVRAGRHMAATPYALAVRDEVHAVVQRAQAVLVRHQALELGTLERSFTIQCHDALAAMLGPPLLVRVRQSAPRASLRILAEAATETPDLRQGQVDMHIGAAIPSQPDVLHTVLGEDRLVVAMRARHPLAQHKLSVRDYAAAEHVTVSRRGKLRDPVDDELATQGLTRRIAASAPSVAAALSMVHAADLLVAVPARVCRAMVKMMKLRTAPMPLATPPLLVVAAWHRRHDADRSHVWLRNQVQEIVATLLEGEAA